MSASTENTARTARGNPSKIVAYRWRKGQPSPNPGGRPKKNPLTEAYRALLEQPFPEDPEGRTYAEMIAKGIGEAAVRGKIDAAKELADRVEGKVTQSLNVQSDDPIPVSVDPREQLNLILQRMRKRVAASETNRRVTMGATASQEILPTY